MKKRNLLIGGAGLILLAFLAALFYLSQGDSQPRPAGQNIYPEQAENQVEGDVQPAAEPIVVTLVIQDFTKPDITFEFTRPMTALSYLEFINSNDPRLQLTTKEYKGLGTLVIQLGEHKNGDDNKYWQYFVNGKMPQVSADKYQLQDGDKLEWKFISSQF